MKGRPFKKLNVALSSADMVSVNTQWGDILIQEVEIGGSVRGGARGVAIQVCLAPSLMKDRSGVVDSQGPGKMLFWKDRPGSFKPGVDRELEDARPGNYAFKLHKPGARVRR